MKKYIKLTAFLVAILMLSLVFTSCVGGIWGDNGKSTLPKASTTTTTTTTQSGNNGNTPLADSSTLSLISLLFQIYSLREVDIEKATEAAIDAFILATGDKYADYYTEEELEEMRAEDGGVLYGIGVNVTYNYTTDTSLYIYFVTPGTPAEKAGLKAGMSLTHLGNGANRKPITEIIEEYKEKNKDKYTDEDELNVMSRYDAFQYVISQIKGPEGTLAKFAVDDGNGNTVDFSVPRGKIETRSVRYYVSETDSSVGIINITEFDLVTPSQFKEAMDDLISKGIKKFVYDLRQNPGGDLESVCAVLSTLLNEGDLMISTKDIDGKEEKRYVEEHIRTGDYEKCSVKKEDIGKYRGYETVVLVDEGSASAAELFTSNLRDYKLADIVGVKTYGKGSMQTTLSLSYFGEQYSGALKLTTKLYFPPCGEGYDGGIGIEPNYTVELSEEAKKIGFYKLTEQNDNQLQEAISILTK